jgi:hypothetical protein
LFKRKRFPFSFFPQSRYHPNLNLGSGEQNWPVFRDHKTAIDLAQVFLLALPSQITDWLTIENSTSGNALKIHTLPSFQI